MISSSDGFNRARSVQTTTKLARWEYDYQSLDLQFSYYHLTNDRETVNLAILIAIFGYAPDRIIRSKFCHQQK